MASAGSCEVGIFASEPRDASPFAKPFWTVIRASTAVEKSEIVDEGCVPVWFALAREAASPAST
jgi:hypothetical protein